MIISATGGPAGPEPCSKALDKMADAIEAAHQPFAFCAAKASAKATPQNTHMMQTRTLKLQTGNLNNYDKCVRDALARMAGLLSVV